MVYSYIDGEMETSGSAQIREHLEECGPCLREYGLEELVKRLVHKCCGQEAVPGELRTKVLTQDRGGPRRRSRPPRSWPSRPPPDHPGRCAEPCAARKPPSRYRLHLCDY